MARTRMGNRTRLGLDWRKVGEGLKASGMDLRHWCSYGTVGVVGDDGKFDPTDMHAVLVAPDGVWVDVRLEPTLIPVTARVQLGVGGTAHIMAPIYAGDEVLVVIPDGDLMNPPVVVAILNSQGAKVPVGKDRKPVFKNDRLLLQVKAGMPVELNGSRINVGDETCTEPWVLGLLWKDYEKRKLQKHAVHVHPSAMGPTGPSQELVQQQTEEDPKLDDILSDVAFSQKKKTT